MADGVERKWAGRLAAERYAACRFRSAHRAARDPKLVAKLLSEHDLGPGARLLDAACGAGRLAAVLAEHGVAVGLDANLPMLALARGAVPGLACVAASALALPFADASFDAVVCCRLLHHFQDEAGLERAVRELVRVSRRLVIASFWDSGSWPALRVRLGLRRGEGPRGRRALPRGRMAELFGSAGATVLGFRSELRFLSRQTFLVAAREPR